MVSFLGILTGLVATKIENFPEKRIQKCHLSNLESTLPNFLDELFRNQIQTFNRVLYAKIMQTKKAILLKISITF